MATVNYLPQNSSYILILVPLYLIAHILFLLIYRLYFHPLAKYPGPFLAKITSLYSAYHGYVRDIHIDVQACHEKYGNFVRYGPNKLLFNTVNGVQDTYGLKSNVKKARFYSQFHQGLLPSALSAYDKDDHIPRRKALNPSFSDAALKNYDAAIAKHTDIFINKMVEEGGSSGPVTLPASSAWSIGRNMALWCMCSPRRCVTLTTLPDYLSRRLSWI
jgi:cytochrome P450